MKTYRVQRCWTVVCSSYCEVEAKNKVEACRLAMEDQDYSDQEICDGSDGSTWIDSIEADSEELTVPKPYREEDVDG